MLGLRVELNGEKQVEASLRRFTAVCREPLAGETGTRIARDFEEIEAEQFASQGGRGGSSWPPLSEAYAARKARERPGRPLLQYDGDLLASVTKWGENAIREFGPTEISLGTRDVKATTHQYGDSSRGIPARPFVMITDPDAERWAKIIERGVMATMGVRR